MRGRPTKATKIGRPPENAPFYVNPISLCLSCLMLAPASKNQQKYPTRRNTDTCLEGHACMNRSSLGRFLAVRTCGAWIALIARCMQVFSFFRSFFLRGFFCKLTKAEFTSLTIALPLCFAVTPTASAPLYNLCLPLEWQNDLIPYITFCCACRRKKFNYTC
jgi:hypothetical protein